MKRNSITTKKEELKQDVLYASKRTIADFGKYMADYFSKREEIGDDCENEEIFADGLLAWAQD